MKAFVKSAIQALIEGAKDGHPVALDAPTARMVADELLALTLALGGRSGNGHFLHSSGRVACPHCHHPATNPYHAPGCKVAEALGIFE